MTRRIGLLALLCFAWLRPAAVHADSTASGDTQITGQLGIGTLVPQARTEVHMSAPDAYALKISSPDGTALFVVASSGAVGVGVSNPLAHLDISGSGDAGTIGLQLRVGNSSNTTSSSQIVFASTAGTYAHTIRTQAESDRNLNNALEFYLWNSTGQPNALGSSEVLSLQAAPQGSTASVHVLPIGTPVAELEVSNGITTGGGTIHRAAAATHSSRALKSDISYLDQAARRQAYEDVKALRHARYRYKATRRRAAGGGTALVDNPSAPLMRGLIYEDAPESVRAPNSRIVLDYRVLNLELALQEVETRTAALETLIAGLDAARKAGKKGR